jgi:1-acyl-sn-glycerol-3-phosphate acyltransferase
MKDFSCFIVRVFLRLFYTVKIIGFENLPQKGRIIVASNHISNIDPPAILSFINKIRNDTTALAKKELFDKPFLGWFLRKMDMIDVDRENADISAIKRSVRALQADRCLLIFPEGTRAKNGEKLQPKTGISYLAKKTKSKILPVRIFNDKNGLKLGKIIIVFDKPVDTDMYNLNDKKVFNEFPEIIMNKIFSIKI